MLLVSMLVAAAPVSAGTLSFSEKTESDIPSTTDKIVQAGTNLYDMAVSADGETIYVAAGTGGLYKSTNGGDTFGNTAATSVDSALVDVMLVAIAPDDDDVVVVVGNETGVSTNLQAFVTTNGGSSWNDLGTIQDANAAGATLVNAVDISPMDGSTRYIACAGSDNSSATAALYYFNLGATTPVWKDAVADFTSPLLNATIKSFYTVAFSPNFASDQVMVGVSGNISGTGDDINLHIASFNQKQWDDDVFDGYPKAIISDAVISAISAVDIALDPEYLGGDDSTRIAFVGVAATIAGTAEGGLYRLKDTSLKEMKEDTAINSVAWDGVNLAAGAYADNNVYRCDDALVSSPTVSTSRGYKEIGVDSTTDDQVIVRFAGSDLVGIKVGLSSAFGRSADNGKTWNDIALIDTTLDNMEDLWVSPDGSVVYMVTSDTDDKVTSLWRKASSTWTRVFNIYNSTANAGFIVRASASDPDVVYLADDGNSSTRMYYSTDGGTAKWTVRTSRYDIVDLAVQDANVAYVACYDTDEVSKTTNGGFTWATDVDSKAGGGTCATITLIADDQLLLGTTTGYVSYSSDGNGSWTKIAKTLSVSGNAQVTASGLATGDYIYAATSGNNTLVERWEIGQSSTSWKSLSAPVTAGYACSGLILYDGGLYALNYELADSNSELLRTLSPTSSTPAASMWSTTASAGETYNSAPSALRISSGSVVIWALDQTGSSNGLFSFTDTLAGTTSIALVAPAAGFQNPINPVNGNSQDIAFSWTKPTTGDIAYQVRIKASDQSTSLITATRAATDSAEPNLLIGPNQGTGFTLNFAPGETYYWQVRTTSPVYSPWSALRKFTIAPLQADVPKILAPANGGTTSATMPSFSWDPVSGATKYAFKLAESVGLSSPLVDVTVTGTGYAVDTALEIGKTYYWAVKSLEPVEGGWSAIANFKVVAESSATAPVIITQVPAPNITVTAPAAAPATTITIPTVTQPAPITPAYIWAIIVIGAVLVIAVIVLIVRTRRTV